MQIKVNMHTIFAFSSLLSAVFAQQQQQIGDFIFDRPRKNESTVVAAGAIMRIEWHVIPLGFSDPATVTLQWREGTWDITKPNNGVTNWTNILTNATNEGFHDWVVPTNMVNSKSYILQIKTEENSNGSMVRSRIVDRPFSVYQNVTCFNGQCLINYEGSSGTFTFDFTLIASLLVFVFSVMFS